MKKRRIPKTKRKKRSNPPLRYSTYPFHSLLLRQQGDFFYTVPASEKAERPGNAAQCFLSPIPDKLEFVEPQASQIPIPHVLA